MNILRKYLVTTPKSSVILAATAALIVVFLFVLKHQSDERESREATLATLRRDYENNDISFNGELSKFDAAAARVDPQYGPYLAENRQISEKMYHSARAHFQSELSRGDDLQIPDRYDVLEGQAWGELTMVRMTIEESLTGQAGDDWHHGGWLDIVSGYDSKLGRVLESYAADQTAIAEFGEDPAEMRTSLGNAQEWLSQARATSDPLLYQIYLSRAQITLEAVHSQLRPYAEKNHRAEELSLR